MAKDGNGPARGSQELPRNHDAEQSVLGSMIRDNHVIPDVVNEMRPESFFSHAHLQIFKAIVKLFETGKPVDLVTLAQELLVDKSLEEIGGPAYLLEIWEKTPTAANAKFYAKIVRERATVRSIIHASTEVLDEAYGDAKEADELLHQTVGKFLQLAQQEIRGVVVQLKEALNEAYDRIDARNSRDQSSISGLATGYPDLDEITAGFQKSEMIIVAARPSVGKTAFALNLIRNIITRDKATVLFCSLEQSRIEIAERLMCSHGRVDSQKLRKGRLNSDELDRLVVAGGELINTGHLHIDDSPSQSMLRIASNARRLKMQYGLDLVVIDYLQLIEPENRRDPRQEQVAQISRRIKALARELTIPVIALAQVNRASEDRQDHRPRLADLRESGSIEQDADTVFLLHRPERFEPGMNEGYVEVIVGKQRNGPTGQVALSYVKQFMRFESTTVGTPFDL
ncbi:MAG: replicative DNA helicase [Planctomycetota bacterium]